MQLIGRVLALCAFCLVCNFAYSKVIEQEPHSFESIANVYSILLAQTRAMLVSSQHLSPAESACVDHYNKQSEEVGYALANETNICFQKANVTIQTNVQNYNRTADSIRDTMRVVQTNVNRCMSYLEPSLFLRCVTETFDDNLNRLDRSNSQSYQVQTEMVANQSQIEVIREGCVNSITGNAKTNLTKVANNYSLCISNIKYQRQLQ